jgi:AcrR family transcriptional regulator
VTAGREESPAWAIVEPRWSAHGTIATSRSVASTRRPSYGPASPDIGRRGADTRTNILDAALRLFDTKGFFNTTIDDIVQDVGTSRATLYQYFPGKSAIFFELLDVCGAALGRVACRICPLGPTKTGFDNLTWWISEWCWVFEKYSTMFVQWTGVAQTDPIVRPRIDQFLTAYNRRVAARLEHTDLSGLDSRTAAMVMTAFVHRMNLFVHTGRTYGRSADAIVDTLAAYLQRYLYPQTPLWILRSTPRPPKAEFRIDLPDLPAPDGLAIADRAVGRRARAVNTIRTLVDIGAELFRLGGFHQTGVDDITRVAGIARGTFYRYFEDKEELLATIGIESMYEAMDHAARLRRVDIDRPDSADLNEWFCGVSEFVLRQAGSIDVWTERGADTAVVTRLGEYAQAVMDQAMLAVLARERVGYLFDDAVATLIFRCLVSRLPQAIREVNPDVSQVDSAGIMVECIRRGFLGLH